MPAGGGGYNFTLYFVHIVPSGCSNFTVGDRVWLQPEENPPEEERSLGGGGPCNDVYLKLTPPE